MPRYIDAVALKSALENNPSDFFDYDELIPLIDAQPTVSTDEVRGVGEWIVKQTAIGKEYTICSVCETEFKFKTDKGILARLDMRGMAYCPKCGAKMEVTDDA